MDDSCSVVREGNWLLASFSRPQEVQSWAVWGGGRRRARTVAWYQVEAEDLKPPVDPKEFLGQKLLERSIPEAVGLLTSADLDSHVDVKKSSGELSVHTIATVGLRNAVRVGDPPSVVSPVGTINLLCHLSFPLTEEAHLEALAMAVEARTTALLEAEIPSPETGLWATGTGTDCIVVAAPLNEGNDSRVVRYVGKHTEPGHLLGLAVLEAVREGIRRWKERTFL